MRRCASVALILSPIAAWTARRCAGSMAVMMAIAEGCLEKNKPDKMRSLVQLAA